MAEFKGAIIGFGNIAEKGHWPTYANASECEIVAAMDPSPERRQIAESLKPGLRTYADMDSLFAAEQLDFVDLCTPPSSHGPLALAALQKGCHVLCEKPLTLKISEYEALAAEVTRSPRTVFTVHNWKYAPIFQKALALLKEGRIGPAWHVEIFTLRDSLCKGATQGAAAGAGPSEDWRKDPSISGGGILVDHGWHAFYLLLNLVNAAPRKVLAKMLLAPDDPNAIEEAVQTLVQFPEADGYVHLTWRAKMRRNSIIVQGQLGTLLIDDDRILVSQHDGKQEEFRFDAALSQGSHHPDWFRALWPDFVEEMRDPGKRGTNFKEAGWCLAMTRAAYESNLHGFKEIEVAFPGAPAHEPALA